MKVWMVIDNNHIVNAYSDKKRAMKEFAERIWMHFHYGHIFVSTISGIRHYRVYKFVTYAGRMINATLYTMELS